MTVRLNHQSDLDAGLKELLKADPRLAPLFAKTGIPTLRRRESGFAGLCLIVVNQQLSTASAGAIWKRLEEAYDPFTADVIQRARPAKLARLGLSAAKIKTMKAISQAVVKGEINLLALADLDADAAHAALTHLHGIGPWTADVYLLFCLGHADAWPAGDLALQEAARLALDLPTRPTAKAMAPLADGWRPWRGVAAHLLWAYYRVLKNRDPVPVQPNNPTGDSNGR